MQKSLLPPFLGGAPQVVDRVAHVWLVHSLLQPPWLGNRSFLGGTLPPVPCFDLPGFFNGLFLRRFIFFWSLLWALFFTFALHLRILDKLIIEYKGNQEPSEQELHERLLQYFKKLVDPYLENSMGLVNRVLLLLCSVLLRGDQEVEHNRREKGNNEQVSVVDYRRVRVVRLLPLVFLEVWRFQLSAPQLH